MKTLIFIRSSFLLTGLLFTVACQNAKLDKKSPPPAQPVVPVGQQYPPGGQGGQRIPPTQQPSTPPAYPPPVDRSYPKEMQTPERPYRPLPEESRYGTPPANRPRQKGVEAPVRPEPNIIPWFEKAGPYEKVVEDCGPKCPPAVQAPAPVPVPVPVQPAPPVYDIPDCSVEMVMDGLGQPGTVTPYPPVEMGTTPQRAPNRAPNNVDGPIEMGKAPMTSAKRSREGQPEQVICPDVNLRKREGTQLDLLFVVDNSASMLVEKNKIAAGMKQFAESLGTEKDLRVAVMSANGPQGSHFAQIIGSVIDVRELERTQGRASAVSTLSSRLQEYMNNMPQDSSNAQGEVGLTATYALATNPQAAKSQGFFREQAALMVVYVSDENDACYDYVKTGARPNYLYPNQDVGAQGRPDPNDTIGRDPFEYKTFMAHKVCKNVGLNGENMSPDLVYGALRNLKGAQPIILSGILYLEETLPGETVRGATGDYRYEKEKGRGYLDLIQRFDLNGSKAFELSEPNFGSHLAQLAGLARSRMDNETEITMVLPAGVTPDPMSIYVDIRGPQGMKRYSVQCATKGSNCAPGVEPARYVNERGAHKVILAAEVATMLKNGAKAYLHYKKKH